MTDWQISQSVMWAAIAIGHTAADKTCGRQWQEAHQPLEHVRRQWGQIRSRSGQGLG